MAAKCSGSSEALGLVHSAKADAELRRAALLQHKSVDAQQVRRLVRQQFMQNAHVTDPEKLSSLKGNAMSALTNYVMHISKRFAGWLRPPNCCVRIFPLPISCGPQRDTCTRLLCTSIFQARRYVARKC